MIYNHSDLICVSGGFDPLHAGHLAMYRDAARYGNLCVILNSDEWLLRKKGFIFLPWEQRASIINDLRYVTAVMPVDDSDGTVCAALRQLKPRYFANGGDRRHNNTPEITLCRQLGIEMLWGVGGDKAESSTDVARRSWVTRPWGRYVTLDEGDDYKTKKVVIEPGRAISLQYHRQRREFWYVASGVAEIRLGDEVQIVEQGAFPVGVERGVVHQVRNAGDGPLVIIEIQSGEYLAEDDIIRIEAAVETA